jgi:alkylated DNA repair dioxygenase AlkB
MSLTNSLFGYDTKANLLSHNGEAHYYGCILDTKTSDCIFKTLLTSVPWKNDEAIIYGKRIVTSRKVAWVGDRSYIYTYSGTSKRATPWTPLLINVKYPRLSFAVVGGCAKILLKPFGIIVF